MSQKSQDTFRLLMNRKIYDILDGDTKYEKYKFDDNSNMIPIAMPYLSDKNLSKISKEFGVPERHAYLTLRWEYLEDLFDHCIKANCCVSA